MYIYIYMYMKHDVNLVIFLNPVLRMEIKATWIHIFVRYKLTQGTYELSPYIGMYMRKQHTTYKAHSNYMRKQHTTYKAHSMCEKRPKPLREPGLMHVCVCVCVRERVHRYTDNFTLLRFTTIKKAYIRTKMRIISQL